MTVEELRIFLYTIANKDQSGDLPSPEQLNSLLARATEEKFIIEYGLRSNQNGIFFQNSQNSTDALAPFLVATVINQTLPGVFVVPADYVHLSSVGATHNGKRVVVTVVNDDEWNDRVDSPLTPATDKYPIARFVSAGTARLISVMPATVMSIFFNYLKKPVDPVWGYTIVNDEPVYNSATSVQMEFAPMYHLDIAKLILSYLGIEFRDEYLSQFAEMSKAQTT